MKPMRRDINMKLFSSSEYYGVVLERSRRLLEVSIHVAEKLMQKEKKKKTCTGSNRESLNSY